MGRRVHPWQLAEDGEQFDVVPHGRLITNDLYLALMRGACRGVGIAYLAGARAPRQILATGALFTVLAPTGVGVIGHLHLLPEPPAEIPRPFRPSSIWAPARPPVGQTAMKPKK